MIKNKIYLHEILWCETSPRLYLPRSCGLGFCITGMQYGETGVIRKVLGVKVCAVNINPMLNSGTS